MEISTDESFNELGSNNENNHKVEEANRETHLDKYNLDKKLRNSRYTLYIQMKIMS